MPNMKQTKKQKSAARQVRYDASIEAAKLEAKAIRTAETLATSPHIEIVSALGKLDVRLSVMETKQDELIRRVGIQNGRVADSEAAIAKIVKSDSYKEGAAAGIKMSGGLIATIITILAAIAGVIAYAYYH